MTIAQTVTAGSGNIVEARLINLRAEGNVKINTWEQTKSADPPVLPYLWVACSQRGTVVRIATAQHFDAIRQQTVQVGQVLGEYWSAPQGCRDEGSTDAGPSRTTVDFDGGVWVANRHDILNHANQICGETQVCGHAVKIGNGLAYQWKDRNNNGILDTSTGLGDIRPWPNSDDPVNDPWCERTDIEFAQDELILLYEPVRATGTRTIAVDRDNNVWVGGTGNLKHGLLNGQTGLLWDGDESGSPDFPFVARACGGYGGLVDANGVLWSARGGTDKLLRFDPELGQVDCLTLFDPYGLAVDTAGTVWNSQWRERTVVRLLPSGAYNVTSDVFPTFVSGESRGVVVIPDNNNVWIANSTLSALARLSNTGALSTTISLEPDSFPTGVAVDSDGFVWVANRYGNNVQRIDPTSNAVNLTVSLGVGAGPYNYSDMTGVNLYHTIAPAGVLTVVSEFEVTVFWESFHWSGNFGDGRILGSARAADILTDLGKQPYIPIESGEYAICKGITGRYLQFRLQLNARSHGSIWPELSNWGGVGRLDGVFEDCNSNRVPDECDIRDGASLDCNGNHFPDECDIGVFASSVDCNQTGVPDECEEDCNGNFIADECDIAAGTEYDYNGDGIPDRCVACCVGNACSNLPTCDCTGTSYVGLTCSDCSCGEVGCCNENQCVPAVDCACKSEGWPIIGICLGGSCDVGACCTSTGCKDTSDNNGNSMTKAVCEGGGFLGRFIGGRQCEQLPQPSPCAAEACAAPLLGPIQNPADPVTTRFLSFRNPNCGQPTALKVKMIDLQHPRPRNNPGFLQPNFSTSDVTVNNVCTGGTYAGHHCHTTSDCQGGAASGTCPSGIGCSEPASGAVGGCARWVGPPRLYLQSNDVQRRGSFRAANLQCTPFYPSPPEYPQGWGMGVIHVFGAEILPSSTYEVQVLGNTCIGNEATCTDVSCPLTMTTARWGDVASPFQDPLVGPPPDQPAGLDVAALLARFKSTPGALSKWAALLYGNAPNPINDIRSVDIQSVLEGFRSFAYPYSGPCPCPSPVTCGARACSGSAQCTVCVGGTNNGKLCGLTGVDCETGTCASNNANGFGVCVRTCSSGPYAGQDCIKNLDCGRCSAGTYPALDAYCDSDVDCGTSGVCNTSGHKCTTGTLSFIGFPCDANADCGTGGTCAIRICTQGRIGMPCAGDDDCHLYGPCDLGTNHCNNCPETGNCFCFEDLDCYRPNGVCGPPTLAECGSQGYCRDRCGRCSP